MDKEILDFITKRDVANLASYLDEIDLEQVKNMHIILLLLSLIIINKIKIQSWQVL